MRRFLLGWIRRGTGLEGIRNGLPNLFEKISSRIGVDAASAQKEQSGHWQADPARINETFDRITSVHFKTGFSTNVGGVKKKISLPNGL